MVRWFKRKKDETPPEGEGIESTEQTSPAGASEPDTQPAEAGEVTEPASGMQPEVAGAPSSEPAAEPEPLAPETAGSERAEPETAEPEAASADGSESTAGGQPTDPFATSELDALRESLGREAEIDATSEAAFADQQTTILPPGAAGAVAADGTSEQATPLLEQGPSDIDLGPEGRGGLWIWLGLIFGMLVAAGAIGYAWWYTTARPIPVPAVVGKSAPLAVQQLNDVGLRLGRVQTEATDTAEVGSVLDQEPDATTKLKPGDLVSLIVAASPKTTEVPTVVGRVRDDALSELAASRLSARIVESYNTSVAAGTVISQIPTAGAELKPGTLIALAVSKGPAPSQVRMPRLNGLRQTDAQALLEASNLRGQPFHSFNASITVGEIYAQSPMPETSVAYQSWVQYLVSDGAGRTSILVPPVVGATRKVAESRLKARGLKPSVKQTTHLSVPKGQVISSTPAANSRVAKGAVVGVLVSLGSSNTTSVPDVSGLSSMEASKSVEAAGFKPTVVEIPIASQTAGMVFGQWPEPGTAWNRGYPVIIAVARLQ